MSDLVVEDLEAYFNLVCNQDDWRADINAIVELPEDREFKEFFDNIFESIEFFTAVPPSKLTLNHLRNNVYSLQGIGYRNGPAGS